jgi:hypothetical protein
VITDKEKYMRQAGLKPKSHKSGVYWTRATARTGRAKQTSVDETSSEDTRISLMDIPPFILAMIILFYPFYLIVKYAFILAEKAANSKG